MSYSDANYSRVIAYFRTKNLRAKQAAEARREELDGKFPELARIDGILGSTGMKILREAAKGKDGLESRIKALKAGNDELLSFRADFLRSKGYPEDYSDVHYECEKCSDTGFTDDGIMCSCLKKALTEAGLESSGVKKLVDKQNFETFDLGYYSGAARESMDAVLRICHAYADNFDGSMKNLLFIGKTGLGKTHLSSAIAKTVIERGFDVVYASAQNIFSDFEKEKFSRADAAPDNGRYFDCDLLIIDDLGTEMTTQFNVSCLYNLINTRLIADKSMLINTNVGKDELLGRYSERITSRLFGEFSVCVFEGGDVRAKKLKGR